MDPDRWCLLIHQLPPRPPYLRAKIRQRLARVGAIPLKNSVYVMPHSAQAVEDLQWIVEEAVAGRGEAYVCVTEFAGGVTRDDLVARFNTDRDRLYRDLAAEVRDALGRLTRRSGRLPPERDVEIAVARFIRRLAEIREIDFFGAPAAHEAGTLLRALQDRLRSTGGTPAGSTPGATPPRGSFAGRTWVSRTGVYIDRIASAWLIRRFVDPHATFRFVDPARHQTSAGEVRFDMVGGEFSHEGDLCTFEVLVKRFGLRDPALRPIAEIVHDVDLKDSRYSRSDGAGVQQMFNGIVAAHPRDAERLDRGFAVLDDLYASFREHVTEAPQRAPRGRMTRERSRRAARRRSTRQAPRRTGGTP